MVTQFYLQDHPPPADQKAARNDAMISRQNRRANTQQAVNAVGAHNPGVPIITYDRQTGLIATIGGKSVVDAMADSHKPTNLSSWRRPEKEGEDLTHYFLDLMAGGAAAKAIEVIGEKIVLPAV